MSTNPHSAGRSGLELSKFRNLPVILIVAGAIGAGLGVAASGKGVTQFAFSWLLAFMFAQIRHGRGLKSAQGLRRAYLARAKIFQKLDGLGRCHEEGKYTNFRAGHARKSPGRGGTAFSS